MSIPGRSLLRKSTSWLRGRIFGGVLILGYHRIAADAYDPFNMCVHPDRFEQHLDILNKRATPISLAKAMDARSRGILPVRAVVLTFDDGYADALYAARPALETADIPATFFIVTGNPGTLFWWDEMALLLRHAPSFQIPCERSEHHEHRQAEDISSAPDRSYVEQKLKPLYEDLLTRPETERHAVLASLRRQVQTQISFNPMKASLDEKEICELAESKLVEIGSHTVSHPRLPDVSTVEKRREVFNSISFLQDRTNKPITSFSFPNGAHDRFVEPILSEAGIRAACVSKVGLADASRNPYRLPRLWVGDIDGAAFEKRLTRWLS